ncbi:hypothetical protein BDZ89DRAFT_423296 [Hymenopellis radicata]|nr:hypothetical protein BDZ89DRAFT_423296 [Hymenopellis radicata]
MLTSSTSSVESPGADFVSDALAYILAAGPLPTQAPVVQENLRPVDLVRKVLDFYPRLMEHLDDEEKRPEPDSSPITKYDRHVHEKLLLKRVEKLPSLIPSIIQHADTMVDSFLDDVEALSADELFDPWDVSGHISSAKSVAMRRSSLVHPAMRLASIIALHPELPEICPLLYMIPQIQEPKNVSPFFSQGLSVKLSDMRGTDKQASIASLPNHRKSLINRLSERSAPLLVWDTFALNGKATLEDMDRIAGVPFLGNYTQRSGIHAIYAANLWQ